MENTKPRPGQARKNGKGDWVDEHGNPMLPPNEGGREGVPEVVEDPVTGKLVPKKPKPAPSPAEAEPDAEPSPKPDGDEEPKREDFPPGLPGAAAWNNARSEYRKKKAGGKSPYP